MRVTPITHDAGSALGERYSRWVKAMIPYSTELMLEGLSEWPAIAEIPGARVLEGEPRHFGRLDVGSFESDFMLGVWECTEGKFEWTEVGFELQTLVAGRLRIIDVDGVAHDLAAGDTFFTRKGDCMVWEVIERVKKVFFTFNSEGACAAEFGRLKSDGRTLRV